MGISLLPKHTLQHILNEHQRNMDRQLLLKAIQSLQGRKDVLHKELEVVDLDLRTLQAQHSRLLNADTAIYKLPNELLAEIFMLCADNRFWPILPKRNCSSFHLFQVVVSQVSRRWREVALGAPLLWNVINLKVVRPINHRQGHILSQLEAHCERSATCFLDITVEFQLDADMASFCKLLGRYSERWRRLSVLTSFQEMDDIQNMLVDAKAPILEHLSLSLGTGTVSSRQQPSVISAILSSSPRLSFLRLAGKALGTTHPPTSSVTTLHLDGWVRRCMTEELFKSILEGAPLLVNLSLNMIDLPHPRDPSVITQSTTLMHLRSLRIRGPCTPVSRLMSLVDMPRLQSLTLDAVETFDSHVLQNVESLILDFCPFSKEDLGKLIRRLPSLSELSIDESTPDIFYMLSPETTDVPTQTETEVAKRRLSPWPRLRTIIVRELQPMDVLYFCNMVFNRQSVGPKSGISPLKRILLDRRSRTVLRTKQKLEWLQESVVVENGIPAKWPPGLDYEDPHDLRE